MTSHESFCSSDTTISSMMPRDTSGDFLSQEFENPVARTEVIYKDETKYANIRKERVFMDNDTWYEVTSTNAKKRSIDVGIVATAAWLTHDQGLNEDRAIRAAKLGIDTTFISPQQNFDRRGHFGRSVCNIIRIADYMHNRHDRDPDHLWVDGISRGAMHALGVAAKAPFIDDKEVIYGDYTVPCFPEGFDPTRDLPQLPSLLMNEFGAATSFVKLPLNALLTYPRTIAVHPRMLFQHLKEVPALLSGDTGKAANNMPTDTFGHVTNYLGDIMGQGRRWEPIFAKYPNLTIENFVGGGHLSIAAPECQEKWQRRTEAIHEIIKSDPRVVSLGAAALKKAAGGVTTVFKHRPIAS